MGGKKKKSMANKLAKMTDEERARYMQHRADIEEEARRKKEQLISTFMKDKVKKEDAFARLNLAKINQNWHQLLRKDKCKQMKESVLHFQEDFQKILDSKNCSIKFILKQIDEAEIQYGYNYQNHIMQIDKIMKTQDGYLNQIKMQYEMDREALLKDHDEEATEITENSIKDVKFLEMLCYAGDMNYKKKIWKQYEFYKGKIFLILNENAIAMRDLHSSRCRASSAIWRLIAAAVMQYTSVADRRRSHLAELLTLDDEGAAELAKNKAIIQNREAELRKLKKRYAEIVTNRSGEILNLQITLEKVSKKYLNMKIHLHHQLINDEKRFRMLVDESNKAIEYLEAIYEKGKRIVQLIEICKKLETVDDAIELIAMENIEKETEKEDEVKIKEIEDETDKILAKFDAALNENGRSRTSSEATSTSASPKSDPVIKESESREKSSRSQTQSKKSLEEVENMFENLKDLQKVWRKHNLVYMNIASMKQESSDLARSNEEYRFLLRQILGNIVVQKNQTKVIPTEEVFRVIVNC